MTDFYSLPEAYSNDEAEWEQFRLEWNEAILAHCTEEHRQSDGLDDHDEILHEIWMEEYWRDTSRDNEDRRWYANPGDLIDLLTDHVAIGGSHSLVCLHTGFTSVEEILGEWYEATTYTAPIATYTLEVFHHTGYVKTYNYLSLNHDQWHRLSVIFDPATNPLQHVPNPHYANTFIPHTTYPDDCFADADIVAALNGLIRAAIIDEVLTDLE